MKTKKIITLLSTLAMCDIAFAAQPSFSSRPNSPNVLYIDYDGEVFSEPNHVWTADVFNAPSFNMTDAEIESSWSFVAEAYKAFDVNVTTDRAVFDAAPISSKGMCIVTTDDTFSPGNGGIALRNTFGNDIVCWSFQEDPQVIVHEFGHTFGLQHDGLGSQEYHPGGSWAPHMGNSVSSPHYQWTKGEYSGATNTEDDLAIISNDLPFLTDEAPNLLLDAYNGNATSLSGAADTGYAANFTSIIGDASNGKADVDIYRFDVEGGTYDLNVTVTPSSLLMVDLEAILYNSAGQIITVVDPDAPSTLSLQGTTVTDAVYLLVRGGSKGDPESGIEGWTNYGSIGEYDVSFNAIRTAQTQVPNLGFSPLTENAVVTSSGLTGIGATITQVIASDIDPGDTLTYSIVSGNVAGSFVIDENTGVITLARTLGINAQSSFSLVVSVEDNTGLATEAIIKINNVSNIVHDEAVDGELSNQTTTATMLTFSPGLNSIKGSLGTNGQSGGIYIGDLENFAFTVPVGYEISGITIDKSDGGLVLLMNHDHDGVPSGNSNTFISNSSTFPKPIVGFSNLQAGLHTFDLEVLYGHDAFDYQLTFAITEVLQPWTSQDIGAVAASGSSDNDSFSTTITASGADIWGNNDAFHFAYETLVGDGIITARVNSLTNTNAWAKAGVMIRETLDADSANVAMVVTASNGINSQSRATAGASTLNTLGSNDVGAPYWVRLERIGDNFTTSESVDGDIWTEVRTWTISMSEQVYIGLAVTSHNDGVVATSVMDYVSIDPSDLDLTYNAADFDSESHPTDENIIRDLDTKIGYISDGTWVAYDNFNFVTGAASIDLTAASGSNGGTVEVRLDSPTGPLISSILVTSTGGWNDFATFTAPITEAVEGLRDLYFVFTGSSSGGLLDVADFTVSTSSTSSSELGVLFAAAGFNGESHPTSGNYIQDLGTKVGYIRNNSWIRFDDFNFEPGAASITLSAASGSVGGTVEVRTGSSTGPIIGSVVVTNTGSWDTFQSFSADFDNIVSGVDSLFFVFKGGNGFLMDLESFQIDAQAGQGNLGVEIGAADFNAESHPTNDNIIRDEGSNVGWIVNNSWIRFDGFDFSSGASSITVSASSPATGGTIEVRTGSATGPLVGSIVVTNTGGWGNYQSFSGNFSSSVSGVEDLYFVFTGGSSFLMNVESFQVDAQAIPGNSGNLGVAFDAAQFNTESHPGDDNTINIVGTIVRKFRNDSWIRFDGFDFGSGASSITISAASGATGGTIEVRTGSETGPIIGSVTLGNTGGWNSYQSFSTNLSNTVSGVDDLYLVTKGVGGVLMKIGSFQID